MIAYDTLDPFTSPLLLTALTVRVEMIRENQIKTGRLMVVCASNHNQKWNMESDGMEDTGWPFGGRAPGSRSKRQTQPKSIHRLTSDNLNSYDLSHKSATR